MGVKGGYPNAYLFMDIPEAKQKSSQVYRKREAKTLDQSEQPYNQLEQITRDIKALALQIANELPERLLKGDKTRHTGRRKAETRQPDYIEDSYQQLGGEWRDWLEVARKYERKVYQQDRYDMRHTILLELHKARQRDGQPLPLLRAYRIASLTVAFYWRELNKPLVRVCIINGRARQPNNADCGYKDKPSNCRKCPFLASSPIQSLDADIEGTEGYTTSLLDTVADDTAIDLDQWQDAKTFLLGCPIRLIEIATKKLEGKPLTTKDRMYLSRYRKQEQKHLL